MEDLEVLSPFGFTVCKTSPGNMGFSEKSSGCGRPDSPPPPYGEAVASGETELSSTVEGSEDPLAQLRDADVVILIDDSWSMTFSAGYGGCTRWDLVRELVSQLAPICVRYDSDGVGVGFFNHPSFLEGVKDAKRVMSAFEAAKPRLLAATWMGKAIQRAVGPYVRGWSPSSSPMKQLNVLVFTDGEPSDDVTSTIIDLAKEMDERKMPSKQVGLQLVQVGDDAEAKTFLKGLDNDIQKQSGIPGLRDWVDTHPFDPDVPLTMKIVKKIVLGGINRRMDNSEA